MPSSLEIHEALAVWVHEGHVLILLGTGDAYDEVANGGVGMAQITRVLRRTSLSWRAFRATRSLGFTLAAKGI